MRRWYRSTDNGRSWQETHVSDRSPLAAVPLEPGEYYDDGCGNLYRYEDAAGVPQPPQETPT